MKPNEIDENYKAAYNKGFSVGYKKGSENYVLNCMLEVPVS